MKISELLDGIRKKDIVLPEFQREYVWNRDQAKKLFSSLFKEYPVGALLFWKTDTPPELKNLVVDGKKLGTTLIILDGQQRLTCLHMLIEGRIPSYYKKSDIKNDPRELFFNISTGEFQYYQQTLMKGNPIWIKVIDCYNKKDINVFEIAEQLTSSKEDAFQKANTFSSNLTRLRNIRTMDFPIQTVPSKAILEDAINIFDLVNSQGTKLTDADLALTHMTGKWPQARRIIKEKISTLEDFNYYFDLTFMTRAMVSVVSRRGLYETIHSEPKNKLIKGWEKLTKILDYLVSILPERAFIQSTNDISTNNIFIPIIAYLNENGGKFRSENDLKRAIHFIYCANAWARYSSQTNQKLDHDISVMARESFPWDTLIEGIIDQRGRIEVKPNDLEGRTAQNPLYSTTHIIMKSQGAVDWFNGIPLTAQKGPHFKIHSHHIFPTSLLYKSGYDPDNHLHRKIVNEIANRAFLTADSNISLSNEYPEKYLPQIEEQYPGALVKQFVPMDPNLWKIENFADFLEARRILIAKKINEVFTSLVSEPVDVKKKPIIEIIKMGESASLEFKSTFQWDMVRNGQNKHLRKSVLKSIAAFLNSDGGTVVIGVEDSGDVCGLSNDLKITHNSNDKFLNLLNTQIADCLGAEYASIIKIRFEDTDGKQVCIIDVDRSMAPVYLEFDNKKEFFNRMGNTTRSLDPEETVKYITQHWS